MLSSLLRPKNGRRRVEQHSPFSSRFEHSSPIVERRKRLSTRHATADFTETELDDENTEEEDEDEVVDDEEEDDQDDGEEDEDGQEETPLLPIFSAAHLGKSLSIFSAISLH